MIWFYNMQHNDRIVKVNNMEWFEKLELWAQILIVVGICVVGLWLISFIVSLIFSFIFKQKIKNGSNAINLLLAQRYEVMKDFIKIASNRGIEIPKEEVKSINLLERISDFQALQKEDRDGRVLAFVHSSHNIVSICDHNSKIANDEMYADKLLEFTDIEESYRQKSALYNSDVIGYNYWVNVWTVKFLLRLLGFKKKDIVV